MRRAVQCMLVVTFLAGLAFLIAPDAVAQAAPTSTVSAMETECGKHVGLTNRIAGCVRESIGNIAGRFFDVETGFYNLVSKFIAGFMTMGIAVYGVMAAGGMVEKVGRDTLVLLIKIAMVAYFTLNADQMYRMVIGGMDSLGAIMVQVTPRYGVADGTTDFNNLQCFKVMQDAADAVGKPLVGPWAAMDCLVDTVFGIRVEPKAGAFGSTNITTTSQTWFNKQLAGEGLQRGMIFFFFSGMKTSVLGLMLGILGFIFMWGILAMIIKSLLTYLAGYIGVAFMMIVSPLFIPLVLFRETKQYFDKWVKLTISFALQPVLILLFISFSIAAVDLALYSGDYSVMYRVAGEASRKPNFSLNRYLTENDAVVSKPMELFFAKTDEALSKTTTEQANAIINAAKGGCTRGQIRNSEGVCANSLAVGAYRDTIDWEKLADARGKLGPAVVLSEGAERKEQQIAREVMAAIILCGVVIFIMNRLMAVVPHILVDLIGDFGQTPNLFGNTMQPWDQGAQQLGNQGSNMVKGAIGSLAGRRSGGAE